MKIEEPTKMTCSTRMTCKTTHLAVVVAMVMMSLSANRADAQPSDASTATLSRIARLVNSEQSMGEVQKREPLVLLSTLHTFDEGRAVVPRRTLGPAPNASSAGRHRSIGRTVLGAAIGAVGGFFAGGFLGAKIEGDRCACDDPGFKGFLIGAPIGAVTGAVLGAKLF
jgi:hypothetical protein